MNKGSVLRSLHEEVIVKNLTRGKYKLKSTDQELNLVGTSEPVKKEKHFFMTEAIVVSVMW